VSEAKKEVDMATGYAYPYIGWRPYCLMCDTMLRMESMPYGFRCSVCRNEINHDLTHHEK